MKSCKFSDKLPMFKVGLVREIEFYFLLSLFKKIIFKFF